MHRPWAYNTYSTVLLSSHEIVGEVHPREKGATKDCAGMPCRPYVRVHGNKEDSGTSEGAFCLEGSCSRCLTNCKLELYNY